ncbi:lipopolysaccharide biosynthesis protein [Marichromatium sp. AB31]|uniref:lipopolysaccharide biosynthesis protein n=1 Tax=Marichromatium sp. AB31 TaxID=2483362 RepID=UPI00168111E7|nr:oligosaccharide flippase family protein [Marichromatium sp. AB31]
MTGSHQGDGALGVAARGSLITLAGTFAGKGLGFALRVLVTRLFGEAAFGALALCLLVGEFARTLAVAGLARGGMRFLALALGEGRPETIPALLRTVFSIPLALSLLWALALFHGADTLAIGWFGDPTLAPHLQRIAFAIPALALLRVGVETSRGFHTTRYATLVEQLALPALLLCAVLGGYLLGGSLGAVIWGMVLAYGVALALILLALRRQLGAALRAPRTPSAAVAPAPGVGVVLRYSLPLFLSGFAAMLMGSLDLLLLGHWVSVAEVGVYAAALALAGLLSSTLMSSVNSILAPLIASAHGGADPARVAHLYRATTRWLTLLALPLAGAAVLAREPLMALFGPGFVATGAGVLAVLVIGHALNCASGGVGQVLAMTGHQGLELLANLIAIALNLALNLALIPLLGPLGAALATAIALVALNGLRLLMVRARLGMQPFARRPLLVAAAGVVVVLGCELSGLRALAPLWCGLGVGLALAALGWRLGLAAEDLRLLRGLGGRLARGGRLSRA